MFILDTDHISLFQRNQPQVTTRILSTPHLELATTIITVEEQLRGRLDRIRQARDDEGIVQAYSNLKRTIEYFQTINVIGYDSMAQNIFSQLRANKLRISTQDLRIAAIALSQDAVLVTRNQRDFAKIPTLKMEDWSLG
jgi:tRNA(fMet)-specific endonuclease VapC